MSSSTNYTVQLYLEIADAIDQFNEVAQNKDDNRFVLESHPKSDIYQFRKSLQFITKNFCKHPLPKSYNIIMDSYKNRVTRAYLKKCDSLNTSQYCKKNSFMDQITFRRSINDECIWNKNGKSLRSDETIEQLEENLNSIYCTENSALLNVYFKENIKKKDHFVSYAECEVAKARCIDCQMLQCKNYNKCCQILANCLLQEPCQTYYNASCYRSYEENWYNQTSRCMKGTTYKFTLTPEFDFNTNEFMCYLQKAKRLPKISLSLKYLHKKSGTLNSKSVKYVGRFSDSNILQFDNLKLTLIPSSISSLEEIIIEKRKYEYMIYGLKQKNQFDNSEPKIHKIFSKSFIQVQMSKPFLHNTETWSKEECHVNISGIYKAQPIQNPSSKIPIEVIQKTAYHDISAQQSVFSYSIIPKGLDTAKIRLQISDKSSLLSLYFCRENRIVRPVELNTEIEYVGGSAWRLNIKGKVKGKISFFSVFLSNIYNTSQYYYKADIVVSKSNNLSGFFNTTFTIHVLNFKRFKPVQFFLLQFSQCHRKIYQKIVFLNYHHKNNTMNYWDDTERPVDISNFILVVFLATICICFFYFLLLAFQAARRSSSSSSMKTFTIVKSNGNSMNYKLFFKIIFYMTLKLFYTVSFTLSLILSVCLSLKVFTIHSNSSAINLSVKYNERNPYPKVYKPDYYCNNIPTLLSKGFLIQIKQQINSQEIVRSTSTQSVQFISKQIIENISIQFIQDGIIKWLSTHDQFLRQELLNVLHNNIKIFVILNDSKWLNLPQRWNSSASENLLIIPASLLPNFNKDLHKISTLLKIFEFSSILQSCEHLPRQIVKQQEHLQLIIKYPMSEVKLNNSNYPGNQKRYFDNFKQTSSTGNWSKNNEMKYLKNINFFTLDFFQIRLAFMLIDAALILYRCYWTFVDIRQMWNPKKQLIHLNQIILKTNQNTSNVRAKSSIVHWTKHHHLECLISAHLAIAAIIILLSIICMNLLILLTSRDHSNWLSKKAGNTIRIRSLKDVKEELVKFNNVQMNPIHRQWQNHKISRIKQFMDYRKEAISRIMHFELFLNHQYFYELCNLQNLSLVPKWSLDFCQSLAPSNAIIPDTICDKSLNFAPSMSFNLSSYNSSRTVIYLYQPLYLVLNILALVLFATSVVGMLTVVRKMLEDRMCRSQNQLNQVSLRNPKNFIQMKSIRYIPNIYDSNLEPPNQYQCKPDSVVEKTKTAV